MNEDALVVSVQESFARVKVNSTKICDTCSARSLCIGQKQKDGTILALNPISARVGNTVTIKIPEAEANRALIAIFGTLLLASLLGLLIGSIASRLLRTPTTTSSLIGLLLGLLLGGTFLFIYFRKRKKYALYPVIVAIRKNGNSQP